MNKQPRMDDMISQYIDAIRKSQLVAAGVKYKDIQEKPVIGIVNSWNEITRGHMPLRLLADRVKAGVSAAGGIPLEFNTISCCDGLAAGTEGMKYILPSRDVIADSIEIMVAAHQIFDGLVFLASCDKVIPGMLIAAARLDLPSIFLTGGTARPEISFSESKRIREEFLAGNLDAETLSVRNAALYSELATCPYMGTANTMACFCEAIGLSLPGSAVSPPFSSEKLRQAFETGTRVVELAREQTSVSSIVSQQAIENGIRILLAIGGSANMVLHIPAIAQELGINVDYKLFHELSETTPLLCALAPNGEHSAYDFHRAGGVPAVMKEMRSFLATNAYTVAGCTLSEIIKGVQKLDHTVIHPIDKPIDKKGGLAVLWGNLAPDGCIVKRAALPSALRYFRGPSRVYNSEEELLKALKKKEIREGEVVIVRYEGLVGGPGMRELHRASRLLQLKFSKVALVTDGRFSGGSSGLAIGYVRPEAAMGGAIAAVKNGDMVEIDVDNNRIYLEVPQNEIVNRLAAQESLSPSSVGSPVLRTFRDEERRKGGIY